MASTTIVTGSRTPRTRAARRRAWTVTATVTAIRATRLARLVNALVLVPAGNVTIRLTALGVELDEILGVQLGQGGGGLAARGADGPEHRAVKLPRVSSQVAVVVGKQEHAHEQPKAMVG